MKQTRLIPKVSVTNYRMKFPTMNPLALKRWFWVQRFWRRRLIIIGCRHFSVTFDFRADWIKDLSN